MEGATCAPKRSICSELWCRCTLRVHLPGRGMHACGKRLSAGLLDADDLPIAAFGGHVTVEVPDLAELGSRFTRLRNPAIEMDARHDVIIVVDKVDQLGHHRFHFGLLLCRQFGTLTLELGK